MVKSAVVVDRVDSALAALAANGEAAWRSGGGGHYRLLEPQTVKFPTKGY